MRYTDLDRLRYLLAGDEPPVGVGVYDLEELETALIEQCGIDFLQLYDRVRQSLLPGPYTHSDEMPETVIDDVVCMMGIYPTWLRAHELVVEGALEIRKASGSARSWVDEAMDDGMLLI